MPSHLRQLTYALTSTLLQDFLVRYALSGPFGGLQFDPDPSTPDSLGAHGHFYFRFIGLSIQLKVTLFFTEVKILSS